MIEELITNLSWRKAEPLTIADATVHELTENDHADTLENVHASTRNTMEFVGKLTQMLHESGALTEEQILQLFPFYKEYRT